MADDASGNGIDDRDGRDDQSDGRPDVTSTDRDDDVDGRRDETPPTDVDDMFGESSGRREPAADDRIPLDLSDPGEADAEDEAPESTEEEYVPEPSSTPIEPGDPRLEHAIFVLLGAIAMILVIVRLLALPLG